jgi:hypothetical protein
MIMQMQMRTPKFKEARVAPFSIRKNATSADRFFGSSPTITQNEKVKTMPKAKKNLKLRDEKPVRDPKGGRVGHHRRHRVAAVTAGTERDPRDRDASNRGGILL